MNPRLVAVSGPCEGQTFVLDGEVFAIGRHVENDLQLPRLEISRHHCVIGRAADDGFTVRDLDSRHGTFVNSRPVRERRLEHSDLLTVGDTALLFLLDDVTPLASRDLPLGSSQVLAASTQHLKPGDSLYLDPERVARALPKQERLGRNLHILLRASTTLQETLDVVILAERLLTTVFEALPAERGVVLLCEPGVEELTPVAVRDLTAGQPADASFTPSRTVVERVLRDRVALGCENLEQETEIADAASVADAALRSLVCAPLMSHRELYGVLYCDARARRFDQDHLELVTALAGIASLALENVHHLRWLERENRRLVDEACEHEMIGESPSMKRLVDFIGRVARADSTLLIRGESGTGKELVARAVHSSSARADRPFVAINCATLSETLLESELFGHERGAFTGAVERKIGKLELAHHGTLFLDEIGELPASLQAKLLRVLQERELERVGGTRPIPVDVRILAATNRDLEAAIRDGGFREDLFYRLNVITCEVPPLRDRRDDIPLLASHFAALHGRRLKRRVAGIAPAARRLLMAYDWPGNVRQLGNAIERAVVLGLDEVIRPEDLPDEIHEAGEDPPSDFQATITATKKRLIRDAYAKVDGDHGRAAGLLGVHPNSLHRMIRNLGLKTQLGK